MERNISAERERTHACSHEPDGNDRVINFRQCFSRPSNVFFTHMSISRRLSGREVWVNLFWQSWELFSRRGFLRALLILTDFHIRGARSRQQKLHSTNVLHIFPTEVIVIAYTFVTASFRSADTLLFHGVNIVRGYSVLDLYTALLRTKVVSSSGMA